MKSTRKKPYKKPKNRQSHGLQLAAAIIETIFAIPILGGLIILFLSWLPLVAALVLHIITLVITLQEERNPAPSIVGIIASTLGVIPFLGWILHVAAAILNWIGYLQKD